MHKLWITHKREKSSEEQVIQALFDASQFLNPEDMAQINLHHPQVTRKHLNLFYGGQIPSAIKNLHKLG